VTPVLLIAAGVVALVAAFGVLSSYGGRYRVARLLATTRRSSVEAALALADAPDRRYVRVDGRLDSDEDFEDHDHRPLVFRRTRFEVRAGGSWRALGEKREQVPFEVREGLHGIAIDADALGPGLVVIPRESAGIAADVADRVPSDVAAATPVRFVIEQVSSVEHATVLGVPARNGTGGPTLTAGLGRPLVLTTLEAEEAMRILAGGRARPGLATALFALGAVFIAVGVLWLIGGALTASVAAATPAPTQAIGGDPRSPQEGPGLVGDPLGAVLAVLGLGLLAVLATTAYVRLTGGRSRDRERRT
jgi:hypothetical protein